MCVARCNGSKVSITIDTMLNCDGHVDIHLHFGVSCLCVNTPLESRIICFQICILSYKKNWYSVLTNSRLYFFLFRSRKKVRDPNETEEEREARRAERRKRREEKAKRESEKSTGESINSQSQIKVRKRLTGHWAQLLLFVNFQISHQRHTIRLA